MTKNNYPTSFQCPPEVRAALEAAAAEEMISASDYVRRALVQPARRWCASSHWKSVRTNRTGNGLTTKNAALPLANK